LVAGAALLWMLGKTETGKVITNELSGRPEQPGKPEISGWIAWGMEEPGYALVASRAGEIRTVSPVWWLVDENSKLQDVGGANRGEVIVLMKKAGVKIYPTIRSELTGEQLSPVLNSDEKMDLLIKDLLAETDKLQIDGIDVDLGGIDWADKERFVYFLEKLKGAMEKKNLGLSVTIKAQDPDAFRIGEMADEVRIKAYDLHSSTSGPGAIAPFAWLSDVVKYNLKLIPKSKIVMGVPAYGYIWPDNEAARGLSPDELQQYLKGKKYASNRDAGSGELVFTGEGFVSWLADGQAMADKINYYRSQGINRFVIWQLGGMDESVFDATWQ
jgi:spore germination protein